MADDEEAAKLLPLGDRFEHKAWKVRQGAYDELTRLFRQAESPRDSVFREHADIIRRLPAESNAVVLENALNCLIAFVEGGPVEAVKRIRADVLPVLCEKGLGAQRVGARAKAVECLMGIVEVDGAEAVVSELVVLLSSKQPKLAAAATNAICELLKAFGHEVVSVKSLGKHLPTIFANADKSVRTEGQALAVQMYRCVGPAISVFLSNLKPIQGKELQEMFVRETVGGLQASRHLRSAKSSAGSRVQPSGQGAASLAMDSALPATSKPVDAFDLADPVDVLERLPTSFGTLVTSANWKERKEALEALLPILRVPKISNDARYGDLVEHLLKRVADVNVLVVVVAAQCLEALAAGLRHHFMPHRSGAIAALLERSKEKKTVVVEALRGALNALSHCILSFGDISEDLQPFVSHKNPQTKAEALSWLARLIPSFRQILKKDAKLIADMCLPGLDDGATEVREVAALAIAKLILASGDKTVMPFLEGVDKLKMGKIIEFTKKPPKEQAKATVPAAESKPETAAGKPEKKEPPPMHQQKEDPHGKRAKQWDPLDFTCQPRYSDGQADDFFGLLLPTETVLALADPVWKTRLTAMDEIAGKADPMCYAEGFDTELVVRFLEQRPGWRDSNVQVLGRMISVLQQVAQQRPFSREAVAIAVPGLLDKLGDAKLRQPCADLLLTLSEQTYCGLVLHYVCEAAKTQKSPRILVDVLSWMQTCLAEFASPRGVAVREIVDFGKAHLGNSNASVRAAAVGLIGAVRRIANEDILPLFSEVGPQMQSTLHAEFAKQAGLPSMEPKRLQRAFMTPEEADQQPRPASVRSAVDVEPAAPQEPVDDLIPRVDITASITPAILAQLADPNWKVRKEGLDQVAAVIDSANRRIRLTSGELYTELRERLSDSNKILVMQALSLCATLAEASGQAADKYIRSVISAILGCLADGKTQVRQEAIRCLDQIVQIIPMSAVVSQAPAGLAVDSPNLRKELLAWLASKLPFFKSYSTEEAVGLVAPSVACLQDRNADVRRAAQGIFGPLMEAIGLESLKRKCSEVAPKLMPAIQPLLDAHRPQQQQASAAIAAVQPSKKQAGTPKKTIATEDRRPVFMACTAEGKLLRAEKDKGMTRWSGPDGFIIRADLIDALKEQMAAQLDAQLCSQLFAEDFRQQILGVSALEAAVDECGAEVLNCLDLLIKYVVYRIAENNPTVFLKCLDLLERLVALADQHNYRVSEYEAGCLFPSLILKSGDSKDSLRPRLKQLFRQVCRIYPASKLFAYFIDGMRAKGAKTRAECLEELGCLLSRNGLSVLVPSRHLPMIGAMIGDRDASVRSAALNVMVQAAGLLGDQAAMMKHLSSLSQKELDMLEERMKRSKTSAVLEDGLRSSKSSVDDGAAAEPASQPPSNVTPGRRLSARFKLDLSEDATGPTPQANAGLFADPTPTLNVRPFPVSQVSLPHPLDHIIDQVLTAADLPCIQAIQRLDEHMSLPGEELFLRLDNLAAALAIRLRECSDASSVGFLLDEAEPRAQKSRLARYVVNSLVLIADSPSLATRLSADRLQQLIAETLSSLVSDPINRVYDDREVLVKAINVLLVKLLENACYDACFCALLAILEQVFLLPPPATAKIPELTMKCLWKVTKQMASRHATLDIPAVLLAVHRFFTAISPIEWKSRAAENVAFQDLPLRTVKTILHEMTQAIGPRIMDVCRASLSEASFVTSYLATMVSQLSKGVESAGGLVAPQHQQQAAAAHLSQAEIHERLKQVCSQICSKPDTNAGLMELWRFRREHGPYASEQIEAFLSSLGDFFHKYISRSLARIDAEQSSSRSNAGDGDEAPTAEGFKAKLVQLRRQMFGSLGGSASSATMEGSSTESMAGQQQDERVKSSPVSTRIANSPSAAKSLKRPTSQQDPHSSDEAGSAGGGGRVSSIVGLKERLARLKGQP